MSPKSYILVPASDADASRSALAGPAELIVLDLEDLVPERDKPRARIMLRTGLSADWADDSRCAVRLNAWESKAGAVDRMALAGLYLPAVMLPKLERESDVELAREGLTDSDLGTSAIHAIIETKEGLNNAEAIASAGVESVVFGAFDLAKALGVKPDPSSKAIQEARQEIARVAAQAKTLSFDMPWVDVEDGAGFEQHIAQAKALGFTGCCAMNNEQAQRIDALWDE